MGATIRGFMTLTNTERRASIEQDMGCVGGECWGSVVHWVGVVAWGEGDGIQSKHLFPGWRIAGLSCRVMSPAHSQFVILFALV